MAAINFPDSPTNGAQFTVGNISYTYNSTKAVWNITSNGIQGRQGTQGVQGLSGSAVSQGGQGIQGRQGLQGLSGQATNQGVQGIQGVAGLLQGSRVYTTTSTSTLSWNSGTYDVFSLTQQNGPLTISTDSAVSPIDGQRIFFRIKCITSGTLTINSGNGSLRALGVTFPTSVTIGNTLYIECVYNSYDTKWDVVNIKEATV